MNKTKTIKQALTIMALLALAACNIQDPYVFGQWPQDCDPALPKVLVIGDSISIGYTPWVAQDLQGMACVAHINDNARYSAYTADHIWDWLKQYQPDFVIWNNGLWDMDIDLAGEYVYINDIDDYLLNLRTIGNSIAAFGVPVLFLTSTPIKSITGGRNYQDVPTFNTASVAQMQNLGIPTADLYTWALPRMDLQLPGGNVHWTDAGYEYLAQFVSKAVLNDSGFQSIKK